MKVVKVINSLGFGGIERVYEIVAKYYTGNKGDLVFVALGFGGVTEKNIRAMGFRVIVLDARTRIPNFGLIHSLYRLLKAEQPDVVHACGAEGNFHGLIAARLAGVPIRVGEEIGIPSHSTLAKKIFRNVYRTASSIIAVAKSIGEYLVVNREVSERKLRVIYNPVDVAQFLIPRKLDKDRFIVLTVCRLHPIKNLKALVRAFSKIVGKNDRAELWVVGEGGERKDLEALAESLNVAGKTKFWGYQADTSAFYSQANVFVLPSFSEGHPVSMIEAMVAGVPIIATKVGGAPEIIDNGRNGWLIDPSNDLDLEEKILSVMELAPEELEAVTTRARDRVLESFGPEEYLNQLYGLYAESEK